MARSTSLPDGQDSSGIDWSKVGQGDPADGTADAPLEGPVLDPEVAALMRATPAMTTVIEYCAAMVEEDDDSSAAAMERMVARVLAADDIEAVLSEELVIPAETVLNKPMTLRGFRVGESDYEEGFPYYALLDVEYGNPLAKHVVSCGGFKVMAQLVAMARLDEWPQVVTIRESAKPTKKGFRPLSLTRAV